MKEIGPVVMTLVIITAILLTLHNNGSLFNSSGEPLGPTQNLKPNKNLGSVRGAESGVPGGPSPYASDIDIDDVVNPGTVASGEHIILSTSTSEPINITGWSIVSSANGNIAVIGNASNLALMQTEKPILVNGSQKIIIVTGKSPIGISFRTNLCTGYIEDEEDFNPHLPLSCPYITDLNLPDKIEDDEDCMEYIESIDKCETPPKKLPNLGKSCENFIKQNVSYQGCVNTFKNSSNFYGKEWRVFLKSNFPLWKRDDEDKNSEETIKLIDTEGRVVDTFTY